MAGRKLPLAPLAVYRLLKELRSIRADKVLAVGGARELATVLRRELARDAAPGAVTDAVGLEGAAALVYVLAGPAGEEDERVLRAASRARVPIVCVLADPALRGPIPFVLATDIVRVPPGSGFPVDEIAERVAGKLGDEGASLAARVPVLRRPYCEALIARISRHNGLIGAVTRRTADQPALTLNQLRLVLGIAVAHGLEIGEERLPEVLAVVGGGMGLRALAVRLAGFVGGPEWAVKGAVAFGGTRAIGMAALGYFEARAAATPTPPRPGAASSASS